MDPKENVGFPIHSSLEPNFIPQVRTELVPTVRQEFDNVENVALFYNNYAKEAGFSTRINDSKRRLGGVITWREFVCSKQGLSRPKQQIEPNKRHRERTRENCGARLVVVWNRSGDKYVVSKFVEGHSHPLATPSKVHLLRSHCKVKGAKKSLTSKIANENVPGLPTCQQMNLSGLEAGGLQSVGILKKDFYNSRSYCQNSLARQDVEMIKEYFQNEVDKNPDFKFAIKEDEEGEMICCFWVDAISRQSYEYFGDVVVFDMRYNTNRYGMIFGSMLGINHHRQTTLFGCTFLCDETSDSFEWLFKEWLSAMPTGPPKMIITDCAPAMTKALGIVLPDTFHRYCIWQIVNKLSEKIGAIAYNESHEKFQDCIWNSESPEEFEGRWFDVVEKNSLTHNEWLDAIYKIRARWVPAYLRNIFSANMANDQISLSFFSKYMSPNNSLWDFITRFDREHAQIRYNELQLDHVDMHEIPKLKTPIYMEEAMRDVYTRSIFFMFQAEFFECLRYMVQQTGEDDVHLRYVVTRIPDIGERVRDIEVEKSSNKITCSCRMFEVDGIPCRHLLAYFHKRDIFELPDQFILRRWMKASKAKRKYDVGSSLVGGTFLLKRHDLLQRASKLVDDGLLNDIRTRVVEEGFTEIEKKLLLVPTSPTSISGAQRSRQCI